MGLFSAIGKALSGKDFNIKANMLSGGLIPIGTKEMLDPLGLFTNKKPDVKTADPAQEQANAENNAAAIANAKAAGRRRSILAGSLLSTGGKGVTAPAQTQSILAYGKTQLGQ